MATVDRVEPAYTPWTPSAAGIGTAVPDTYAGRHRCAGSRVVFSLRRLFYVARHRLR